MLVSPRSLSVPPLGVECAAGGDAHHETVEMVSERKQECHSGTGVTLLMPPPPCCPSLAASPAASPPSSSPRFLADPLRSRQTEGSPDREDAKAGDDAAGEVVKQREKKARGGGASASVESKKRVVSKLPDGSFPSVLASPSSNPNPNPDPHSPSWAVPTPSTPSTSAAASAADGPLSKGVVRGRRTHSPGQLEGQLKTPSGKPMKVHSCPAEGCEAAFKRSEHLKRHYRSVHLGAKRESRPCLHEACTNPTSPSPAFACEDPKCPKSFSRKDNLRQHVRPPFRLLPSLPLSFLMPPPLPQMKMVHQLESPPWHRYVPPGAGASSKKNSNLSNTSSEDPNLTLIAGLLNAAAAGELDVDAEGEEVDAEGEVDGASALDHQALQAALNGNGKRDAPESERPLAGEVLEPEAKRPRITRPDEQHGTGGVQADLVVDPSLDPSLVDVEVRGGARAHYDDEDDSVGVVGLKELEGQLEL